MCVMDCMQCGHVMLLSLMRRPAMSTVTDPLVPSTTLFRSGVAVQTLRCYGSCREIFMIGRVLRQPGGLPSGNAVADLGRLILRRGVRDAVLTVCFDGQEERVSTDRDGYFRLHLRLRRAPPSRRIWPPVEIELNAPATIVTGGQVFIPPPSCGLSTTPDPPHPTPPPPP